MSLILVVEDDDDVRDFLIFRLERLGHQVVPAADGADGLEAIRAHRPDLVVTDWNMPRMTGIELCAAIRGDAELQGLPVLIVTARGTDTDRAEALAAGASDVIRKPFVPVELVSRIGALLGASTAPRRSSPSRVPPVVPPGPSSPFGGPLSDAGGARSAPTL